MVNSQSELNSIPKQSHHALADEALESNNSDWTVDESAKLYNLTGWGEPYFAINQLGNVTVAPQGLPGKTLDLIEIVESAKQRGITLPLLIRFPEILADRIARLHDCMAQAIARYGYLGHYQGVFPIKCHQNRHLINTIVNYGKQYQFGLEAGSKAELIIALASLNVSFNVSPTEQPLLMCNGYKDSKYLETALLATKLGQKPILVIEQPQELDLVLAISQKLAIEPIIGVRAKLDTKGIGQWSNTTGERAKFGLTVAEILEVVNRLSKIDKLDCLQLLHFHIGSQISAIGVIKTAIREASQIYVQLVKLGANMQYLNVGGGLAVDYDGSKTDFPASKNYNMQNYANDIVAQVKDACDQAEVTHPILVSESGRAIAAHQSVLVCNVLDTSNLSCPDVKIPEADVPLVIRNFWSTYQGIDSDNLQESYHDAIEFKQEALSLFNFGYLSLVERAKAEELYWACCHKISELMVSCADVPDELIDLPQTMTATYYINLSIFRSIPDTWAINQLFPIMPLHRLQENPTVKAVLADITCDSDGKIDRFIDRKGSKQFLELHPLDSSDSNESSAKSKYYLGMFLVGAYQEIMGNLHNLFGDTNVIQVKTTASGFQIDSEVQGDTIEKVLNYVEYNSKDLLEIMGDRIESARQNHAITLEEAQKLLQNYAATLNTYTYLS
jgi:arginine decarboxylase